MRHPKGKKKRTLDEQTEKGDVRARTRKLSLDLEQSNETEGGTGSKSSDHHGADSTVKVPSNSTRCSGEVRLCDSEDEQDDERDGGREEEAVEDVLDEEVGEERAESAPERRRGERDGVSSRAQTNSLNERRKLTRSTRDRW